MNIIEKRPRHQAKAENYWPLDASGIERVPATLKNFVCVFILLISAVLFFLAIVAVGRLSFDLLGTDQSRATDAVKSFLPLAAAAVGLPLIIWRLIILNRQAEISEAHTQIDRETQYTTIFSKSVEQLGETREVKETKYRNEILETLIRTVANIEVRLGGIHSLTRLAEESDRDASKIFNMLLSYVRENSWSDRNGNTSEHISLGSLRYHGWTYAYRRNAITDQTKEQYAEYCNARDKAVSEQETWAALLVDTRVDVNEAVDATIAISPKIGKRETNVFYECLFVGRWFKRDALKFIRFERCFFVRCRFEIRDLSEIVFQNCHFVSCNFSIVSAAAHFKSAALVQCQFNELSKSKLVIENSYLLKSLCWSVGECEVYARHSDIFDGMFSGDGDSVVKFNFRYSSFSKTPFSHIQLSPDSYIVDTAFAECEFSSVDLSKIEKQLNTHLEHIAADPRTQHQPEFGRPETWPPYDPDYRESDEIPF